MIGTLLKLTLNTLLIILCVYHAICLTSLPKQINDVSIKVDKVIEFFDMEENQEDV